MEDTEVPVSASQRQTELSLDPEHSRWGLATYQRERGGRGRGGARKEEGKESGRGWGGEVRRREKRGFEGRKGEGKGKEEGRGGGGENCKLSINTTRHFYINTQHHCLNFDLKS